VLCAIVETIKLPPGLDAPLSTPSFPYHLWPPAPPTPAPTQQFEEHMVDGQLKRLLVHRKGSTRAFPPHHPLIPVDYQLTGQPVLIGGTMGTCSYVLTGVGGMCTCLFAWAEPGGAGKRRLGRLIGQEARPRRD
jgi:hypothetical protein